MAEIVVEKELEDGKVDSSPFNGENKLHDAGISCQVNLGSGNTECCVRNCSTNFLGLNNKAQITFVTFPKDPSRSV